MVRKGYRNPPYHNWIHAFTVAHFCYLLYRNAKISNHLRYEGHKTLCRQQFILGLTLTITSVQVVETLVHVITNSPSAGLHSPGRSYFAELWFVNSSSLPLNKATDIAVNYSLPLRIRLYSLCDSIILFHLFQPSPACLS